MGFGSEQAADSDMRVSAVRRDIAELIVDGVTDHVYETGLEIAERAFERSERHVQKALRDFDRAAKKREKEREKEKDKDKDKQLARSGGSQVGGSKDKPKTWEDYEPEGEEGAEEGADWAPPAAEEKEKEKEKAKEAARPSSSSASAVNRDRDRGRSEEEEARLQEERQKAEEEAREAQADDFQDCVSAAFKTIPDLNAQKIKQVTGFVSEISGFQYMLDNYAKSSMLIATSIRDVSTPQSAAAAAAAPSSAGGSSSSSVVSRSSQGTRVSRPPQAQGAGAGSRPGQAAAVPSIRAPRPKADDFAFKVVSAFSELCAKQPWLWSFVLHSKDPKRYGYKNNFSFGREAHQAAETIKERIEKVIVRQLKNIVPMGSILEQSAAVAGYSPVTSGSVAEVAGSVISVSSSRSKRSEAPPGSVAASGSGSTASATTKRSGGPGSVVSGTSVAASRVSGAKSGAKRGGKDDDDAATDVSVNSSVSQRGASGKMPRGSGNLTEDKLSKHNGASSRVSAAPPAASVASGAAKKKKGLTSAGAGTKSSRKQSGRSSPSDVYSDGD